jgi:hypothetical protein
MTEEGIKLGKLFQRILEAKPGTEIPVQVTIGLQTDVKKAFQFASSVKPVQIRKEGM